MTSTSLRQGFAETGRVRLQYVESGPDEGPTAVLLPGWPQTAYTWRRVQPILAEAGRRTIAFHLPGQTESDFMPDGVAASADNVAEIVLEAIRLIGVDSADVVAHDVGGWIGFSLAARHPEVVRSLALIETQLLGISPDPQVVNAPKAFQYFLNYVPGLGELLTHGHERAFLAFLFEHKALRKAAIGDDDLTEYLRTYGDPRRMTAGFDYYRAVPENMKSHAAVAPLAMPVLAIGGEGGVGHALLDALKDHCPDLEGGQIDGAGHYLPEEAPDELSARIMDFLSRKGRDCR